MKKILLTFLFFSLFTGATYAQWSVLPNDPRPAQVPGEWYLYQVFTPKEWSASNFATPAAMQWHRDARYGMFIHFGLSAHEEKDLSWPIVYQRKAPDSGHGGYPDEAWQKTWPKEFRLEKFNADEWVKIAKDAGVRYVIVIAKHHDGFHMWDTKYSDFKITNTPFGRDYLKEVADACHRAGMRFGIYYSQRDWYHPDYAPIDTNTIQRIGDAPYYKALPGKTVSAGKRHQLYKDYQFKVVEELCTRYGKIDEFWFDAVWWGGMFTPDMWDSEKLTRMIRRLQPGIIINNRASLPGDFDTPEQRVGMYQKRAWESAMTLNGSWAFSHEPVKPVRTLIREMLSAAAGNGNVLLSWGAHWDGAFDPAQKDTLLKIGSWLKQYGQAYYSTKGGPWLPDRNRGSVFKGSKVYLYVFDWTASKMSLPALADNQVLNAVFLQSGKPVTFTQNKDSIRIVRPAQANPIVTLIELTLAKPAKEPSVTDLKASAVDLAWGSVILSTELRQLKKIDGFYRINLDKTEKLTGITIQVTTARAKILLEVSGDGKTWEKISVPTGRSKKIRLSTFNAGAEVPGKQIRYLRLQTAQKPENVKISLFAGQ
jgi:alpha-L-fucosidase